MNICIWERGEGSKLEDEIAPSKLWTGWGRTVILTVMKREVRCIWRTGFILILAGIFLSGLESVCLAQETSGTPVVNAAGPEDRDAVYRKMEVLAEVLMQVKRNYVDEKEYGEIVDGAIHGMLQSLDSHSDYLDPKAFKDMKEDTSGSYGGIGAHLGIRNNMLTVIAPIEDSPAFKAGLISGDVIVAIDGSKTQKMNFRESIDLIRGRSGTKVRLTIAREGEQEPVDIEIRRDFIEVESVKGARVIRDGIGYIRITQFSLPTEQAFQKDLDKLLSEGIRGLIIDIRNNPGGLVKPAVSIAGKFLKEGQLIVTTKGRESRKSIVEERAKGDVHYTDLPLVVLVNEGSASSSEILAGALQDSGRAVLLGETTYGKGSVQSIIPLATDMKSAIRLTTARYFTPSGRIIHEQGIEPDILVYVPPVEWMNVLKKRAQAENDVLFTEEEKTLYSGVRDRQLDRAVDLIEALTIYRGTAAAGESK